MSGLAAQAYLDAQAALAAANAGGWYSPAGYGVISSSYYNKYNGAITSFANANYRRLPPIPVTPGQPIRITSTVSGGATALVIWVTSSMAYISRQADGIDNSPVEYVDYEVMPPTGAAYALITSYYPPSNKVPAVKLFGRDPVIQERLSNVETGMASNATAIAALQAGSGGRWAGKKLLWMGTSIPAGSTTSVTVNGLTAQNNYPKMVAAMLGANVTNVALGSSIARAGIYANKNSGGGDPLGWTGVNWDNLWRALSMTAADKDELINNWVSKWYAATGGTGKPTTLDSATQTTWRAASYEAKLTPNLDADLFLFDHGHNDLAIAPGGYTGTELMDRFNANPASRDRTEFHGAINYLIDVIMAANPKARIGFVGHYEYARKSQIALCQAAIANFWEFPIIKTWEKTGWSQQVITGSGGSAGKTMTQVWMPDNLHPHSDTAGNANYLLANILAAEIARVC